MGMVTPTMDTVFTREVRTEVDADRELRTQRSSALSLAGSFASLQSILCAFDAGLATGDQVFSALVDHAAVVQRVATEGMSDIEYDYPADLPS